jgi:hypothetical protein
MRVLPLLAAFVMGGGSAFLVACGGGDNLIPSSNASSIENALNQVSSDFDAGKCTAAQNALTKLHSALLHLPNSVDSELRTRLREGVDNLDTRVRQTCTATPTQTQQQTQTQDTNTDTGTTDTGTTDTGTTDTGTTDTGTTDTGTTSTGTTNTGTTNTGTTTGTTTGTDTTGGTPPGDG